MLSKGVIRPYQGPVVQSRLFSVPKAGTDKRRMVLDLSALNVGIVCPTFKMVSVSQVRQVLPSQAWLTSIDLSDSYWHIPIAQSYQKYLSFEVDEGKFVFNAMPFGLNIAPRIFTKISNVLLIQLRTEGIQVFVYLDD